MRHRNQAAPWSHAAKMPLCVLASTLYMASSSGSISISNSSSSGGGGSGGGSSIRNTMLHYGNYCGPGPTLLVGCRAPLEPVDHVDATCMRHDLAWCRCYAKAAVGAGGDPWKGLARVGGEQGYGSDEDGGMPTYGYGASSSQYPTNFPDGTPMGQAVAMGKPV